MPKPLRCVTVSMACETSLHAHLVRFMNTGRWQGLDSVCLVGTYVWFRMQPFTNTVDFPIVWVPPLRTVWTVMRTQWVLLNWGCQVQGWEREQRR